MSGRLSWLRSLWPFGSSGRSASPGHGRRFALDFILRFAFLYGAVYLVHLPLQHYVVRALAAASTGVLSLIDDPALITGLIPQGNSIVLLTYITGTTDALASWDAGNLHVFLVVSLALVLAVPLGTWASRGRLAAVAIVAVMFAMLAATVVQIKLVAEAYASGELGLSLYTPAEKAVLERINRGLIMAGMILIPATVFLISYVSLWGARAEAEEAGQGGPPHRSPGDRPMPRPTARAVLAVCLTGVSVWGLLMYQGRALAEHPIDDGLEKILAMNPGAARAHLAMAVRLYEDGKNTDAIKSFQRALEQDPNLVEGFLGLGNIHIELGEFGRAAEYYNAVLARDPGHARARYNLGNAFYEQGLHDLAEREYRVALEQSPLDASAHKNLGVVLIRLDRPCEGLRHLERSVTLDRKYYRDGELNAEISRLQRLCAPGGK